MFTGPACYLCVVCNNNNRIRSWFSSISSCSLCWSFQTQMTLSPDNWGHILCRVVRHTGTLLAHTAHSTVKWRRPNSTSVWCIITLNIIRSFGPAQNMFLSSEDEPYQTPDDGQSALWMTMTKKQVNKHPTHLDHLHVRGVYDGHQHYRYCVSRKLPDAFNQIKRWELNKMCMYAGYKPHLYPREATFF